MKETLLEQLQIRTTHEQKLWQNICETILTRLESENTFSFSTYCEKELPLALAQRLQYVIGQNPEKTLPQILAAIQRQIKNLPTIHLVLAFSPSGQYIDTIIALLRKKTHPQAILSLSVQPTIIGGFSLDYQGTFVDKRIQTMLQTMSGSQTV